MIVETTKDIFSLGADALVNPVNCVGVAGKGLALEFKKRFPEAYESYKAGCEAGRIEIGHITGFRRDNDSPVIIHFPTKLHWKDNSKLEYIEQGLFGFSALVTHLCTIPESRIVSVAIPALGCGLGGLNWKDVKPLIVASMENINVTTYLIEPKDSGQWTPNI